MKRSVTGRLKTLQISVVQLSERPASLGNIGEQLKPPENTQSSQHNGRFFPYEWAPWRGWLCFYRPHWGNYISISFQIEWNMIVVTVFLPILNQTEFHLVVPKIPKLSLRSYSCQFERNENLISASALRWVSSLTPIVLAVRAPGGYCPPVHKPLYLANYPPN